MGPTALAITGSVEIDGPVLAGGGLTIAPDATAPQMRLFYVAPGAGLTLVDLTLQGGVAQGAGGGAGQGGAVWSAGTLTLLDDTLSKNSAIGDTSANGQGGAVYNNDGQVSITNSTLTANTATGGSGGSGQGGAVFSDNGKVTVLNATLALNTAGTGGALSVHGDGTSGNGPAKVQLTNSILAGSATASLAPTSDYQSATVGSGSVVPSGSNDLIQNNGGFPVSFSKILTGMDPMLMALAYNGGATQTMALAENSPVLYQGLDSAAPLTDQRGAQRGPVGLNTGSHSDLGAFEDTSSYLVTSTDDGTEDGTLRAAVLWANASFNPLVSALTANTANVVRFDTGGAFAQGGTIALSQVGDTTEGPSALPIYGDVEIDWPSGTGQGVTISAASQPPMRLFNVGFDASLTLVDLTLAGGVAHPLDGTGGDPPGVARGRVQQRNANAAKRHAHGPIRRSAPPAPTARAAPSTTTSGRCRSPTAP